MAVKVRAFVLLAAGLATACGAASAGGTAQSPSPATSPTNVRYRLLLRENPVNSTAALRCYAACQPEQVPESYFACLERCPGFETTQGAACQPEEVPPLAACFTARSVAAGSEPQPGLIVVAASADVALVVGLVSVCAARDTPCGDTGAGLVP